MELPRLNVRFANAALCLGCISACAEDVGPCTDADKGRDTALMNGQVVYAGQAMITRACATGCHASTAQGLDRRGVPAGLDFDLLPVSEQDAAGSQDNADGERIVKLKEAQRAGLQRRRDVVFSHRDEIWQQLQDGLMPPRRTFESALSAIFATRDATPCARGKDFTKLEEGLARRALRSWLACGAPIVEANGAMVEKAQAVSTVGYQFPSCEPPDSSSSKPVTLDALLTGSLSSCSGCHPTLSKPDFSSLEQTRATVLESAESVCNDKPYVTPGDPQASFLYDILALDEPGCAHARMPVGGPYLSERELSAVAAWITAGAPVDDSAATGEGDPSLPEDPQDEEPAIP